MQQIQPFLINNYVSLPTLQFPQRRFKIIEQLKQEGRGIDYIVKPEGWNVQQNLILKILTAMSENEKQSIQRLINYQKNEDQLEINKRSQIIRVFDLVYHNEQYIMIIEISQENLYNVAQNYKGKWTLSDKIKILKQLSQSISFLHNFNIIHRDIKPENFVKVGNDYKLTNFCFMKQIKPEGRINNTNIIGSQLFNAPEIRNGEQNYSFEIDIWSLGATFYEILTEQPFSSDINPQNITIKNNQFQFQANFVTQSKFKELLSLMLDQNPQKRLKINQVNEQLKQIENLCQQPILKQQSNAINSSQVQFGFNPTVVQQFNTIGQPNNTFINQSTILNNSNNNIKQDIEQLLQEQFTKQDELFQRSILQLENSFKSMLQQQIQKRQEQKITELESFKQEQLLQFDQIKQLVQNQSEQITEISTQNDQNANLINMLIANQKSEQIIKEQKNTELEKFKQEQLLQYDQIKQLAQDQTKQIAQISTQNDQNTNLINGLFTNEKFENKINELKLQIKESIIDQKDIQNSLKNNFDQISKSQTDNQKQQQNDYNILKEKFDALKQDLQVKLQDIHHEQLKKISQEQQEIKQIFQLYLHSNSQQINYFIEVNKKEMGQTLTSVLNIGDQINKQNQNDMSSINQNLQELKQENLKIINVLQKTLQQASDEIVQQLLKQQRDLNQKQSENIIQQINEKNMKGINQVQDCQKLIQHNQVQILNQIQGSLGQGNQNLYKFAKQIENITIQINELTQKSTTDQQFLSTPSRQEPQKQYQYQSQIERNNLQQSIQRNNQSERNLNMKR